MKSGVGYSPSCHIPSIVCVHFLWPLTHPYTGSEYISEDPSSQPVATGANVTLTCRAPLGTFVQWVTGDLTDFASVEVNEWISTTWSGGESQLQIRDFVASEHAKEYSCLIGLPRTNAVFTCPANISHASKETPFHVEIFSE